MASQHEPDGTTTQGGPRDVATEARAFLDSIERGSAEIGGVLREQVQQRPFMSLGAGFAVGYVLGGGLTLKLSGIVLAAVGRAALANALSAASRGAQGS